MKQAMEDAVSRIGRATATFFIAIDQIVCTTAFRDIATHKQTIARIAAAQRSSANPPFS